MIQKKNRNKSNLHIKHIIKEKEDSKNILKERKKQQNESLINVDLIFGMDNGTTGTLCSWNISNNEINFCLTPIKNVLNYQKETTFISRLDHQLFKEWIELQIKIAKDFYKREIKVILIIERPLVNPQRFYASLNAIRAFEAMLIIFEQLNLNYIVIDSKEWQHFFFGKNTLFLNLKNESAKLGEKIIDEFNGNVKFKNLIQTHGDADALLITKYGLDKLLIKK